MERYCTAANCIATFVRARRRNRQSPRLLDLLIASKAWRVGIRLFVAA